MPQARGHRNSPGRAGVVQGWSVENPMPDPKSPKPHPEHPAPANDDEKLDEALKESFPASDPPESTQPGVTGWDKVDDDDKKD